MVEKVLKSNVVIVDREAKLIPLTPIEMPSHIQGFVQALQ